jgi:hypothetical protein
MHQVRTLQVAQKLDEGWQLQFLGTKYTVTARPTRAQRLHQFMPGNVVVVVVVVVVVS